MRNAASSTNVNSANVQLYGQSHVTPDARMVTAGSSVAGQAASHAVGANAYAALGSAFGTYIQGIGNLLGAGEGFVKHYYGILEERWTRDAKVSLSKAYRDKFNQMAIEPKYMGKGADYLMKDWEGVKDDIYNKFIEDNKSTIPAHLVRNIGLQINEHYADRIGALQVSRQTEYDHKSRIAAVQDTIDTARLAQIGDIKSLQSVGEAAKNYFPHDPVLARNLAEQGINSIIGTQAKDNPSLFLNYYSKNKDKIVSALGPGVSAAVATGIEHATSQARAAIQFAWAQENQAYTRKKRHEAEVFEAGRAAMIRSMASIDDKERSFSLQDKIDGTNYTYLDMWTLNPSGFTETMRSINILGGNAKIENFNKHQKAFEQIQTESLLTRTPSEAIVYANDLLAKKEITFEEHQKLLDYINKYGKNNTQRIQLMQDLTSAALYGNLDKNMDNIEVATMNGLLDSSDLQRLQSMNQNATEITNLVGSRSLYENYTNYAKQYLIRGSNPFGLGESNDRVGMAVYNDFLAQLHEIGRNLKRSKVSDEVIRAELDPRTEGTLARNLLNYVINDPSVRNDIENNMGPNKPISFEDMIKGTNSNTSAMTSPNNQQPATRAEKMQGENTEVQSNVIKGTTPGTVQTTGAVVQKPLSSIAPPLPSKKKSQAATLNSDMAN